jgi:hypothetical protein
VGGETANISAMAEKLSKEIFDEFFWQKSGPYNSNWSCITTEHKKSTHPADVVFSYLEPYDGTRRFMLFDLKSYSKGSITSNRIQEAINSLSLAVSCAEISKEWQKRFRIGDENFEVSGLLFLYNHDDEYDRDFKKILSGIKRDELILPERRRIFVLGPEDIVYLATIVNQIKIFRSDGMIPAKSSCDYFCPDLISKKSVLHAKNRAATIEMLTSKTLFLKYRIVGKEQVFGVIVFYRGLGETEDEFVYLFDMIMNYQQLNEYSEVRICTLNQDPEAASIFENAKKRYVETSRNDEKLIGRLSEIMYQSITTIKKNYSEIEIGMDQR